jgi:hypothetical protein
MSVVQAAGGLCVLSNSKNTRSRDNSTAIEQQQMWRCCCSVFLLGEERCGTPTAMRIAITHPIHDCWAQLGLRVLAGV